MTESPRFKPGWQPVLLDERTAVLLAEGRQRVLRGELYRALVPLVDGAHSADAIADALAGRFRPEAVYARIIQLEQAGLIGDADAHPNRAAAWTRGIETPSPATKIALRLTAVDRAPADRVAQHLVASDWLDVQRADWPSDALDASLPWVVVSPDHIEPALEEFNRVALAAGAEWVLFKPTGVEPWLGPWFEPGQSGCWECLAEWQRGHRLFEWFEMQRRGMTHTLRLGGGWLEGAADVACRRFALELARAAARAQGPTLRGRVLSLRDGGARWHGLARLPHCPACGDARQRQMPKEDINLRSRTKCDHRDGGHRVCTARATIERVRPHVSPITGLVGKLEPVDDTGGLGRLCRGSYWVAPSPERMADSQLADLGGCCGKGRTREQAAASALGEAVERYASQFRGDEPRLRAPYADVAHRAVHPHALMGFSKRQYAERNAWRQRGRRAFVTDPYDESIAIDWSPAWSLTEKRWKLAPSAFLFTAYPSDAGQRYTVSSSNGAAAGNCLEEAIVQGLLELIERDAVAIWWYNRVARPGVDCASFGLDSDLGPRRVLDLTNDLGVPVFAAVAAHGAAPRGLGFGAHLDPDAALWRAVTEQEQCLRSRELEAAGAFLEPAADTPARPRTAFVDASADDLLDDIRHCVALLAERGLETLVADLSRPEARLPVVKVIVPGLRHWWPRFGPGRLYDVPAALGWRERPLREHELNPVPFLL